jgi:hypothetical protein
MPAPTFESRVQRCPISARHRPLKHALLQEPGCWGSRRPGRPRTLRPAVRTGTGTTNDHNRGCCTGRRRRLQLYAPPRCPPCMARRRRSCIGGQAPDVCPHRRLHRPRCRWPHRPARRSGTKRYRSCRAGRPGTRGTRGAGARRPRPHHTPCRSRRATPPRFQMTRVPPDGRVGGGRARAKAQGRRTHALRIGRDRLAAVCFGFQGRAHGSRAAAPTTQRAGVVSGETPDALAAGALETGRRNGQAGLDVVVELVLEIRLRRPVLKIQGRRRRAAGDHLAPGSSRTASHTAASVHRPCGFPVAAWAGYGVLTHRVGEHRRSPTPSDRRPHRHRSACRLRPAPPAPPPHPMMAGQERQPPNGANDVGFHGSSLRGQPGPSGSAQTLAGARPLVVTRIVVTCRPGSTCP